MITRLIMLICIGIFILIHAGKREHGLTHQALRYGALYPPIVKEKKEYWRFLTSNFVHVDGLHLFMNMYALYYLGGFFEVLLGTFAYSYLVLMSAITTSAVTYFVSSRNPRLENTITLGASGIFYGYFGAMIALGVFFQGIYLDFLMDNMYIIAINVAFTVLNKRISKTGHLGGLLGGFMAMAILIGTGICVY